MVETLKQPDLNLFGEPLNALPPQVSEAVELLSRREDAESRGAVYTRPEVVDFILDLAGYTTDQPLHEKRILEPSFGGGEFLLACIARLLKAWSASNRTPETMVPDLADAIRAVELHHTTYEETRERVLAYLCQTGIGVRSAQHLVGVWLMQGDFLLMPLDGVFDFVVGNPPYVRQERIPSLLLTEYRKRFATLYDRADLYVPFIERSLGMLAHGGKLGFICTDRWMKNRYGAPLRELVARDFHLDVFVDMIDTPSFSREVTTYPAITVISRKRGRATRVAFRPAIQRKNLTSLTRELCAEPLPDGGAVREQENVVNGREPWIFTGTRKGALLRRIEEKFPLLEEVGCKIGIGVATGADRMFIASFDKLDVEPDRKLPLVSTRDICSGEVCWQGFGVLNPFSDSGALVDLNAFPRLKEYFEERKHVIAKRHCARKSPGNWYRTIDKIIPDLAARQKLLIPDIKGVAHVVYEKGGFYPHHNLYYVVSDAWDLRALQGVLLSGVTRLTMTSYSTQMRGGYFRFQAQYLRRIRLPRWEDVPIVLRQDLADAAVRRDLAACDRATFKLYGLSKADLTILEEEGNGVA